MANDNPFPAKSFALLGVIAALLVSPRFVEGQPSNCDAVSHQIVTMMMAQVTEAEITKAMADVPGQPAPAQARVIVLALLQETLLEKVEARWKFRQNSFWPSCAILYWVNVVSPPPKLPP